MAADLLTAEGTHTEIARLLALLQDAQEERDLLRHELDAALSSGGAHPAHPASPRAGSSAEGGAAGLATPTLALGASAVSVASSSRNLRLAEERAMRTAFFELTGGAPTIGAAELSSLHRKLGEPLTEAEAREAMAALGEGGRLTFAAFVSYWWGCHGVLQRGYSEGGVTDPTVLARERERKRQRYFRRFQLKRRSIAARLDRVTTEERGAPNTLEWRLHFFTDVAGERTEISPWHDIPLMNEDGTLNMIVEIPRWTRKKLEIATHEEYNPIKLDSKNGLVRIITYGDQLFNYGAFPQTWESPHLLTEDPVTGRKMKGDNDPIDVVEIGAKQQRPGSIIKVKVLGVLGLIDAGDTDWKVFAISVDDPLASRIHTLEDMKVHMPGALEAERDYLRYYKVDPNEFIFGGEVKDEVYAKKMIADTHESWKKLVTGQADWSEAEGSDKEAGAAGGSGAGRKEAEAPSILSASLSLARSRGSAGALAAMVGAPSNATNRLLAGGQDSSSEAEGPGGGAPQF